MNSYPPRRHPPFDFRPQPDYPPRKHKPVRRKAVTIAAGFHCQGGVIICADSEMTHGDALKIGEEKIQFCPGQKATVVMTGAGHQDFIKMAFEKLAKRLEASPEEGLTSSRVQEIIEEVVLEIYGTNIASLPPSSEYIGFSTLAAVQALDGGRIEIIKTTDTAVTSVGKFDSIGTGFAFGKYLADNMYDPQMTISQGVTLAAYLVYVAKKYVPGCGGNTSIFALTPQEVLFDWDEKIAKLEAYFHGFDRALAPVFLACPDEAISEQEFKRKLAEFNETLIKLRKDQQDFPWEG
jgi:hypothetical protein